MSSKSEISIHFDNIRNQIPKEFLHCEDLEQKLKDFNGENCDVFVRKAEAFGSNEVYIELDSTRHKNLIFQQDLLKRYLQAKYSQEVTYLSSNVWIASEDDNLYWEMGNGEDFNDF